jgi:hypothetical protein
MLLTLQQHFLGYRMAEVASLFICGFWRTNNVGCSQRSYQTIARLL